MDDTAKLLAIEEVKKVKAKYCRAVDTKDMALLRSIFTPDITYDERGAAQDTSTGLNAQPTLDSVVTGIDGVMGLIEPIIADISTSVHHCVMPEIDILGPTTAKATWAMVDMVQFSRGPVKELTGYGHYHETYEKQGGAWKIKSMKVTRLRMENVAR